MEGNVRLYQRTDVSGPSKPAAIDQNLLDFANLGRREETVAGVRRRKPRREGVKRFAHLIEMTDLLGVQWRDDQAALPRFDQQPAALE
jgi:hypothetical protein